MYTCLRIIYMLIFLIHFVLSRLSQGFAHNRQSHSNERKTGFMEAKVFFKTPIWGLCVFKFLGYMRIAVFYVVAFVKPGSKKKKITKAERLKLLQEEEERRQKEEGTKYTMILFSHIGNTNNGLVFLLYF